MAFRKSCDTCGKLVDLSSEPFLQVHLDGSISEQVEYANGEVKFRYLTERDRQKLAFCDSQCFLDWLDRRRDAVPFKWRGE